MTQATRDKIEALANKSEGQSYPYYVGFEEGANPFAEWCERFEKKFKRMREISIPIAVHDRRDMIDEVLKEYLEWLGETDE
ncbi:MAG: hypothetical protein GY861_18015 [bacterium]|nr:hypothetical protein [bacterium]